MLTNDEHNLLLTTLDRMTGDGHIAVNLVLISYPDGGSRIDYYLDDGNAEVTYTPVDQIIGDALYFGVPSGAPIDNLTVDYVRGGANWRMINGKKVYCYMNLRRISETGRAYLRSHENELIDLMIGGLLNAIAGDNEAEPEPEPRKSPAYKVSFRMPGRRYTWRDWNKLNMRPNWSAPYVNIVPGFRRPMTRFLYDAIMSNQFDGYKDSTIAESRAGRFILARRQLRRSK